MLRGKFSGYNHHRKATAKTLSEMLYEIIYYNNMRTTEILKEIERLPFQRRIFLIEKALHTIREKEEYNELRHAANVLYSNYKNDKELTIFTNLDFESFYEAR